MRPVTWRRFVRDFTYKSAAWRNAAPPRADVQFTTQPLHQKRRKVTFLASRAVRGALMGRKRMRTARDWRRWSLAAIIAAGSLGTVGCRANEDDLRRWADTRHGPEKLAAVLRHDKYTLSLRTRAALTLIGMRPRGGQRVGIDAAINGVAELEPAERTQVVAHIVPEIVAQLTQPPGPPGDDPSLPYKDAAYSLLTHDPVVIEDPALQAELGNALTAWAMADFLNRLDAPQQKVGMPQLLKTLGPSSVNQLPTLIKPNQAKLDRIVQLIAEIGDAETKALASKNAVEVAKYVVSDAWRKEKAAYLRKANEESGIKVDAPRFAQQLANYQEEETLRAFATLKRVGGSPAVDFLLAFAAEERRPDKMRVAAIAALDGHLEGISKTQIGALLDVACAENTPNALRDASLRRVIEMPRPLVIERLYGLFQHPNWKVRWLTAELILKKSEAQHLPGFMDVLNKVTNMSISEPLRYGKLMGEINGVTGADIKPYLATKYGASVRTTALGYYYSHGSPADLGLVEPFVTDLGKVPACAKGANDCEWRCSDKEITTIGEYVAHCIKPAMLARKQAPAETEAKP